MRRSVTAALFLLAGTTICSLASPLPVVPVAAGGVTQFREEEYSVILQQIDGSALVRFRAPCLTCTGTETPDLLFELYVNRAERAGGGTGVFLNGNELDYRRSASAGHGSGIVSPLPDSREDDEVLVEWRIIHITAPPGSANEEAAQLLTVKVEKVGNQLVGGDVGFSASFSQADSPKILRLCTHLSDPEGNLDAWRDPADSDRLENMPNVEFVVEDQTRTEIKHHWQQLQDMRTQLSKIEQRIQAEEHTIRRLLQQDCSPFLEKWKRCSSFGCKIKVSLETIPEMLHRLRYSFGSLPSSLPEQICSNHYDGSSRSNGIERPETSNSTSNNPPVNSVDEDRNRNITHTDESIPPVDFPSNNETRKVLRNYACFLLALAIGLLLFKFYRNTNHCMRKRADLAARREERRTRRAYQSAARRLRWKQWWERRSYQATSVSSSHGLDEIQYAEGARQPAESDQPVEPDDQGAMHAEILGLRRVLEFVGELVGPRDNSDTDTTYLQAPPRYTRRYLGLNVASAPTAGLAMSSNSPISSSLLSLDTVSSLTLDTLETGDMDPPSYSR